MKQAQAAYQAALAQQQVLSLRISIDQATKADLVVAVVCNGMPGRERHQARLDAISSSVHVDLGIAGPEDPGRAKPFPTLGL